MFDWFLGNGGVKCNQIQKDAYRDSFSTYLPYHLYNDETGEYINNDGSYGLIWECTPLIFGGANSSASLAGLLRQDFPAGSVLQFILYSDNKIDDFVNSHLATKVRDEPIIVEMAKNYEQFIKKATGGFDSLLGIPARNFRLFFTIKSPTQLSQDSRITTHEFLNGAKINPRVMPVEHLLKFLREIFNDDCANPTLYDPMIPLRRQIIKAETEIEEVTSSHIQIGKKYFKCITPKNMAKNIDVLSVNRLFGGFKGKENDAEQINTPFIYTLNIIIDDTKADLNAKSAIICNQRAAGGLSITLGKKVQEFLWAEDVMERERFMRVIPIMWVFSDSKQKTELSSSRARRLWESEGFIMQEDRYILKILYTMALPFGVYYTKANLKVIERDFFIPTEALSIFIPTQGDYMGCGTPVVPLVARKGQVMGIDLFDKSANNHNLAIYAESGSGKSFLLNHITSNYYAANNMIRLIDIGYSYYKNCKMVKGRYIDLGREDVNINPFADIVELDDDLYAAAAIISKMVYSTTNNDPTEDQMSLIKDATRFAYYRDEGEYGIDHVFEYLSTFPAHANDERLRDMPALIQQARLMAFTIKEFTSSGSYGRFFNGKSNFDVSSDPFVVLELDGLLAKTDLFNVATMQVVNATTKDLYKRGGSGTRKLLLFEEAYQFLKSNDSSSLKITIESGYRRARKYGSSFGIVTQSIMDGKSFGSVGPVINANSAFKFYLQSTDIHRAKREGIVDYNDFEIELMSTVGSQKPRYSEIYMDTPRGKGVARLVVDPYSYYVYTSDKTDNNLLDSYVNQGIPYEQAINMILAKKAA